MTVESSAQTNPPDAETKSPGPTRQCENRRCQCPTENGNRYCSPGCETSAEAAGYCPCEHDGCYRECDLVMKGGVTSGIAYPPLVYKLYENNYRFRSIGGTSAGAIMAAFTAAAEFGRESRGFEKLYKIKEQLGKDDFLLNLFQPSGETRPLYEFLRSLNEVAKAKEERAKQAGWFVKTWRLAGRLQRAAPLRFLFTYALGALAGYGIAYLFLLANNAIVTDVGGLMLLTFGLLGALAGYLAAFGIGAHKLFKILTRKIPDHFFGMCTGLKEDSAPPDRQALTNWMSDSIDALAGIPAGKGPLTFGMLKGRTFARQQQDEEGLSLRMMTSNVSQNQPYVLPFADQFLLFNEEEFRQFFPAEVVEYMKGLHEKKEKEKEEQKRAARARGEAAPATYDLSKIPGYYFLPAADDLPIIVATRLSLSFPLLLCALPLYTIIPAKLLTDETQEDIRLEKSHLKLNWFSDGGIASNFPLQFFDSWLPTRPSFGINLTSLPTEGFNEVARAEEDEGFWERLFPGPAEKKVVRSEFNSPTADTSGGQFRAGTGEAAPKAPGGDQDAIYLPAADDRLFTEWVPLTTKAAKDDAELPSLPKFIWAIFTTAQNYRDNMQAMLPGYRERIVQIRLSDDEGGLNLAMGDQTIRNVMEKGAEAGRVLLSNFDFRVHQWVRFQVLLIQMEKYFDKAWRVAGQKSPTRQFNYERLLEDQLANQYPYHRKDDWPGLARQRMEAMGRFIEAWGGAKLGEKPPLPEAVLRVTPEI